MIANNITYKGLNFTTERFENTRVLLQDFDFNGSARTRLFENQLSHGGTATRTLGDLRLFTVSGIIVGTTPEIRETGLEELRKAVIVGVGEEYSTLAWEDFLGNRYKTQAKVYRPIQYRHRVGEPIIEFSFELLASKHEYFSFQKVTQDTIINESLLWNDESIWIDTNLWDEGDFMFSGGTNLETTLPTNLSNVNGISVENKGNFTASARIEIIGEVVNPKIINHTNLRFYGVDATTQNLVIDNTGTSLIIQNNGVNIENARTSGSLTMLFSPGVNILTLQADSEVSGLNMRIIFNYTYA